MKVALVCIVKKENAYLEEYVEYYHNLGVNHIFIYDNNDTDGENPKDVLSKYSYVEVIDYRGKTNCQIIAYDDCYKKCGDFDWLIVCDADEFLHLNEDKTIQEYLSRSVFADFDNIKINWRNFSDSGLIGFEDNFNRKCLTRFTEHENFAPNPTRLAKTIVRTNLNGVFNTPHSISGENIRYCDNVGNKCCSGGTCLENYDLATFDHYRKTIIEFIEHKLNRGWADDNEYDLSSFNWFFNYSKHTPLKDYIAETYLKTKKIVTEIPNKQLHAQDTADLLSD